MADTSQPFAGPAQQGFLLGECLQVFDGEPGQIMGLLADHVSCGLGRLHGEADIVMQMLRFVAKARNMMDVQVKNVFKNRENGP